MTPVVPLASAPEPAAANVAARARTVFLASVALTVLVYVLPYGRVVGYPLLLLSTLAHEMGHGLAAVLVGGDFHSFVMWSDGSGSARWSGDVGRIARAVVAAGGLVGPALAALVGFTFGRGPRRSRTLLTVVGIGLVVAELWVVRNPFGWVFVGVLAALLLAIGLRAQAWLAQLAVVFLAVQLALSVFSRGDYLFTPTAETAAGRMPSDVAQMADALLLPYWLWGALCGALSVGALVVGLWVLLTDLKAGRGLAPEH